jgi:hypothetical protein
MSAENGQMLGLEDIMNPPEVDLLPAGNYPLTIKNGLWQEEHNRLLLFCQAEHGTDLDVEDITAFLNFPTDADSNTKKRDKSKNITSWFKAAGLTPSSVAELTDPEVWKGRQVSADIVIWPAKGEYSASNNIKSVNTIA